MSASERLAALAATHERVVPIFRRVGLDDWKRDRPAESVMDALPEIVAVVEAAEQIVNLHGEDSPMARGIAMNKRPQVVAALTALEEKLT